MTLKTAKIIRTITNVIGLIVGLVILAAVVVLLFLWASNHLLSFAIVVSIIVTLGLIILRCMSSDVIEQDKEDEEFYNKNGRYMTESEKTRSRVYEYF